MKRSRNIRRWFWWHRWSSLVCTLFLLLLCITGLPLIFADEIEGWLSKDPPYATVAAGTPPANLDNMINLSRQRYAGEAISSVFIDDDEPQTVVTMIPRLTDDFRDSHSLQFDSYTGALRKDEPPVRQQPATFIGTMLSLHTDLFMDLGGELFLGLMGVLFVVSIISGIVLYGPFMKKLDFGEIRKKRARRLRWLDLHNLLGIATALWLLVVGITGVINELSTPLFGLWQMTDVRTLLDSYKGNPLKEQSEAASVQAAVDTARKAVPGRTVVSVVYPGDPFGSPFHYVVWVKGNRKFSSRLFNPVLVDARTGKLERVVSMPVYLRALEVSRPLHFGDYGGMPLKILWALFDCIAIVVLVSGIYLWFARARFYKDSLEKITAIA